jgi:hypothetical protein
MSTSAEEKRGIEHYETMRRTIVSTDFKFAFRTWESLTEESFVLGLDVEEEMDVKNYVLDFENQLNE